ncbi:MAG: VOC family protein [Acidobacteria bacterium]|nr:VOC family protein [Acidobacteriota bacterium]
MSQTKSENATTTRVECVIPILSVRSIPASIRYYTEVLGFRLDWGHPEVGPYTFASVSRDCRAIMLCEGSQGKPGTWLWIGIDGDIDVLYKEYTAKGAKLYQEPTNYEWAYEMRIEDPDGHVVRFGSEPKSELPIVR